MKATPLFLLALLNCALPSAHADSPAAQSIIVCRSSGETREIRIYDVGANGCRVDYVKHGAARTLWKASTDRKFCAAKANTLAATLARDIFTCRTNGSAQQAEAVAPAQDTSDLTVTRIGAANQWLQQRVEALRSSEKVVSGPDAKRYSAKPDFLSAADVDGDGKTDLVLGWSWASYRCDGTYLTVLINDGSVAQPVYRAAEVQLPGNCGAQGWLSSVQDVKERRIAIDLQQRYPGADNRQHISATLRHDGRFTFFDPAGKAGSLASIEKSLPMKSD